MIYVQTIFEANIKGKYSEMDIILIITLSVLIIDCKK